jgi:plastocyanin
VHNTKVKVLLPLALFSFAAAARPQAIAQEKKDSDAATKRDVAELRQEVNDLRRLLLRLVEIDEQRLTALRGVLQDAKAGRDIEPSRRAADTSERASEPRREDTRKEESRASSSSPRQGSGAGATISGRVKVTGVSKPNAYVFVEDISGRMAQGKTVQIKQADKQFVPSVVVVQKGTRIEFPNVDKVFHNVFSLTPGSTFDLGSYGAGEKAGAHVFAQPGAVDVFCNLHSQMAASILVVPNPHWTKVNADGTYELRDVPAGKHKIVAWTPNVAPTSQWATLASGAGETLDFTLEGREGVPEHTDKKGLPYSSYR